jgi:hypothetical protein
MRRENGKERKDDSQEVLNRLQLASITSSLLLALPRSSSLFFPPHLLPPPLSLSLSLSPPSSFIPHLRAS